MKWYKLLIIFAGIVIYSGCKNDKPELPQPVVVASSMTFNISYKVDADALIFDSLMYTNDAGNQYSVYRVLYFLSKISLVKSDSSTILLKDYQYIDASKTATNQFTISNVPDGNYIGISFNIGIDSVHNVTGGLPVTVDNMNMEWPEPLGGGYHIMKFEGHFSDLSGLPGFNMHLGLNQNIVPVKIFSPVFFDHSSLTYRMSMNLNEWFRNPAVYDFNVDGNYSMSDMLAMQKLSINGTDVFSRY